MAKTITFNTNNLIRPALRIISKETGRTMDAIINDILYKELQEYISIEEKVDSEGNIIDPDFFKWLNESVVLNIKIYKTDFWNLFLDKYIDSKKWLTQKMFAQWLEDFSTIKRLRTITGKDDKGRYILFYSPLVSIEEINDLETDFFTWAKETIPLNEMFFKSKYFDLFVAKYISCKPWFSRTRFAILIENYSKYLGATIISGKNTEGAWTKITTNSQNT